MKRPDREPDYVWRGNNGVYLDEFWFFEMITNNPDTKQYEKIIYIDGILCSDKDSMYKSKIQEAYQEFLEKEKEIEQTLIGDIYE